MDQDEKDLAPRDGRPQSPMANLAESDLLAPSAFKQTSGKQQVPSLAIKDEPCKSSARVKQSDLMSGKSELHKSEPKFKGITSQEESPSDDLSEVEEECEASLLKSNADANKMKLEAIIKDVQQRAEEQRQSFVMQIRELEDKLAQEKQKCSGEILKVNKLETDKFELSKQLDQEKKSRKSSTKDCKKMKIKVKKYEQNIDELKATNEGLNIQMSNLTKRCSKLSADHDQVQQKLRESETKRRASESTLEELAQKLSNLKELEEKVQEEKNQNETKVKELTEKLEETQANSDVESDSVNKLRTALEQASTELKREQEAKVKNEISLQILEKSNAELKSSLEQVQIAHRVKHQEWREQNEANISALKQQLDEETKSKLEANKATRNSKRQVKMVTAMLKEAELAQQQEKGKLERAYARLQNYRDKLEQLEDKYSKECVQRRRAEHAMEEAIDAKDQLETEIRKLKSQIAGGTAERIASNASESAAKQTASNDN